MLISSFNFRNDFFIKWKYRKLLYKHLKKEEKNKTSHKLELPTVRHKTKTKLIIKEDYVNNYIILVLYPYNS